MKRAGSQGTAASVKQRLLNLAKERREDFNFLLTRFAVERFLYRLHRSRHAKAFVLKGAMLFHLRTGRMPHRTTRDVDFTARGSPDLRIQVEKFREICAVRVARDGLLFLDETVRAERIQAEDEYQGVRVHLEARMGSARIPLQVDVAFGDVLTPPPRRVRLKTLLEFPSPTLFVCPWETVIAEKFQALVELGMANSRMKDYFDLYHLANTSSVDGALLTRAIRATFRRRRTPVPRELPTGLSPAFSSEPLKQAQWRAFARRPSGGLAPESLEEILSRLREFLLPPMEPSLAGRSLKKKWRPGGPWLPK
jgi:predicted nucleotidyltransferase component of viral defense system